MGVSTEPVARETERCCLHGTGQARPFDARPRRDLSLVGSTGVGFPQLARPQGISAAVRPPRLGFASAGGREPRVARPLRRGKQASVIDT